MVDTIEVFRDVQFQAITTPFKILPYPMLQSPDGAMCPFSFPTGIGVIDKALLVNREQGLIDGPLHDPVSKRERHDQTTFRFRHEELTVRADLIHAMHQLVL